MTLPTNPLNTTPQVGNVAQPTATPSPRESSPAFRRLLESLENLAQEHAEPEPVDDAESLKRAIEDADTGFQQAMDLRRALEDAFKTRLP